MAALEVAEVPFLRWLLTASASTILIVTSLIIYNYQVVALASAIMIITILMIFNLQLFELPLDHDDHHFDHL